MAGPATILIVDDEPKNIDYLEQELEGFGYSTVSASNGEEALAIVQTKPPSLILLDVMMPVMDGFKTCSVLKASDETRFIPVIIMTALDAVEDRVISGRTARPDHVQATSTLLNTLRIELRKPVGQARVIGVIAE